MLAYFTASIVGKKYHLDKYKKIIEILESRGIEVIHEHILQTSESQIRLSSREARLTFHRQLENWITSCDLMIAEASFPSISVGYEISLALSRGKPILVIYVEGDPPSLLAYHESEKIVCEKYSFTSLEGIISDFLNYVRGGSDSRFTFFISSKQAAHLNKVSREKRIPKSAYLRDLIDCDMERSG